MNKKTKLGVLIAAIAAVVSVVILIVVFWDKLLERFPCFRSEDGWEEDLQPLDPGPAYNDEERQDFADLSDAN